MAIPKRKRRELLYFPLTDEDHRAREGRSYRIGRWIDRRAREGIVFVPLFVVLLPVLLALDVPSSREPSRLWLALALLWILSIGWVYAYWSFKRQERSEHRRAYRLRESDESDDVELFEAKKILLAASSTEVDRERAVDFLVSRGACVPYSVSFVRDALWWMGSAVIVALFFVIIVWLF